MSQRAAVISIVGKPNAGKSTLLNQIIGQKISIVTPKVQTTRNVINGILTEDSVQLVFLDTPGLFVPKTRLEKLMVRYAWSSVVGADMVILLLDSTELLDNTALSHIQRLISREVNLIFVLNKQDDLRNKANELIITLQEKWPAVPVFKISALHKQGLEGMLKYLKNHAPSQPFFYNPEEITTLPTRFIAAEITREQLFLQLQQEIPYKLTVETELLETQADSSIKLYQVIIAISEGHKKIILGHQGNRIKNIGMHARLQIEKILGVKVHLFSLLK